MLLCFDHNGLWNTFRSNYVRARVVVVQEVRNNKIFVVIFIMYCICYLYIFFDRQNALMTSEDTNVETVTYIEYLD